MKKAKTNDTMIKSLIKELDKSHPLFYALLRERIVHIMDITIQSIEDSPEQWNNGFINPDLYKQLDAIVKKHLGFDD